MTAPRFLLSSLTVTQFKGTQSSATHETQSEESGSLAPSRQCLPAGGGRRAGRWGRRAGRWGAPSVCSTRARPLRLVFGVAFLQKDGSWAREDPACLTGCLHRALPVPGDFVGCPGAHGWKHALGAHVPQTTPVRAGVPQPHHARVPLRSETQAPRETRGPRLPPRTPRTSPIC